MTFRMQVQSYAIHSQQGYQYSCSCTLLPRCCYSYFPSVFLHIFKTAQTDYNNRQIHFAKKLITSLPLLLEHGVKALAWRFVLPLERTPIALVSPDVIMPMVVICLTVDVGLYIVCYLFVVLSPCAFLAGDYILLGRLVQYLDAHHYLRPLRAQLVSWIFIISDGKQSSVMCFAKGAPHIVITFLIQAAGGGLSTATDVQTAQNGGHIFLAGIAAQLASFVFFTITCLIFGIRA